MARWHSLSTIPYYSLLNVSKRRQSVIAIAMFGQLKQILSSLRRLVYISHLDAIVCQ